MSVSVFNLLHIADVGKMVIIELDDVLVGTGLEFIHIFFFTFNELIISKYIKIWNNKNLSVKL